MRAAGDSQVIVRLRDVHLIEEHIGHIVVVVLPGVYQDLLEFPP